MTSYVHGFDWLHRFTLTNHQLGLLLTWLGGLMIAVDVIGRTRVERIERAILALFKSVTHKASVLIENSKMFLGEEGELFPYAVLLVLLLFLVFLAVCRYGAPFTVGHRILYASTKVVCLLLFCLLMILLILMIFFVPPFVVLAIVWCVPVLTWIILSPLLVGSYLKERYRLGGTILFVGVLVLTAGFGFELAASFER